MRELVFWLLVIGSEIFGFYFLVCGIKRYSKNPKDQFKFIHLFQNMGFNESSGEQLIVEGILGILLGMIGVYLMLS